jgi:hypothetical protein
LLTFDFKPFKNPETKNRRKDSKSGMLALLATPVKKIIAFKENNNFKKQNPKSSPFQSLTNKDKDLQQYFLVIGQGRG